MTAPIPDPLAVRAGGLRLLRRVVLVLCVATAINTSANVSAYITAQGTHDALCALRGDLEKRVASSRAFLKENPNGIPGIPAKLIRDGVTNQERTIKALRGLSCPAP